MNFEKMKDDLLRFGMDVDSGKYNIDDISHIDEESYLDSVRSSGWGELLFKCSSEEIVYLIKGVTIMENTFSYIGGSVGSISAIIPLFYILEFRGCEGVYEIGDWLFSNTLNPYVPTGLSRHGIYKYEGESYYSYKLDLLKKKLLRAVGRKREVENIIKNAKNNVITELSKINHDVYFKTKNDKRREEMINFLCLSEKDQMVEFANHFEMDPLYFPETLTEVSDDTIDSLSDEIKGKAIRKIKDRRKGPWKDLYERIVKSKENNLVVEDEYDWESELRVKD